LLWAATASLPRRLHNRGRCASPCTAWIITQRWGQSLGGVMQCWYGSRKNGRREERRGVQQSQLPSNVRKKKDWWAKLVEVMIPLCLGETLHAPGRSHVAYRHYTSSSSKTVSVAWSPRTTSRLQPPGAGVNLPSQPLA